MNQLMASSIAQAPRELLERTSHLAGWLSTQTRHDEDSSADLVDQACSLVEMDIAARVDRLLRKQAGQIQRALERIRAGSYELCENCGQAIEAERRVACPEATRCLHCQEQCERASGGGRWSRA